MAYKFNPFTGKLDYYEATASGFATTELDNLGTTDLQGVALTGTGGVVPDVTNASDYGGSTKLIRAVYTKNMLMGSNSLAASITMSDGTSTTAAELGALTSTDIPSGNIGRAITLRNRLPAVSVAIHTVNSAVADAAATDDIYIETGNKSAGTGASGSIFAQPGTSSGGVPGTINLLGGIKHAYESLVTTQALTLDQTLINTVGTITLTLPAVSGLAGKYYTITHTGTSLTDVVTIDGNGAETVNGVADFQLYQLFESVTLYCDGAIWRVSNRYIPSNWTSYTPTGTWTSNTTYTGMWKRVGDSVMLQQHVTTTGTPTTAALQVDIPANMTIDTAKIASSSIDGNLGYVYLNDNGTAGNRQSAYVYPASGTALGLIQVGGGTVNQASPFTFASGDDVRISTIAIPITGWEG